MSPAEILLEQARGQLARQESKLDAMRTLVGGLLAAGGVVAGFIAPALSAKHPGWAFPALIAFAVSVVAGVPALYPRHNLMFDEWLESYAGWIEANGTAAGADQSFALGLTRNLEASRDQNKIVVERVAAWAAGACIAFGVEVLLWVVGLLAS